MTTENTETPTPVVHLDELIPDRCNYTDQTFRAAVERFMSWAMPGFPLGLLDTSDPEKWEIHQPAGTVEEHDITVSADEDGEITVELPEGMDESSAAGEMIREYAAGNLPDPEPGEMEVWTVYLAHDPDGDPLSCHESEDEAEQAAREAYDEHGGYGFPWAHSWAHIPDDQISDEDLHAAGWVVATYTAPDGDTYRLAGIDGGGYSFDGQHFGPLYAAYIERRGWTVPTDKGHAIISTGPRGAK